MGQDRSASPVATSSNARLPHVNVPVPEIQERLTAALTAEGFDSVAASDLGQRLSRRLRGVYEVSLDKEELTALREAARRQTVALMAEVAGTESRPLQHELAQTIDRLEALTRRLDAVDIDVDTAHA